MSYATLNQQEIVATIARLHRRISERFPDANLARVAADLVEVGDQHAANVQRCFLTEDEVRRWQAGEVFSDPWPESYVTRTS